MWAVAQRVLDTLLSSLSVFGVAVRNFYSFIVEVLGRSSCHRSILSFLSRWDLRQWMENNWSIDTGSNQEPYRTQLYKSEWALITSDDPFNGKTGSLDWSNFPSKLGVHDVMVSRSRQGFLFGKCLFLDKLHVQYPP